MVGRLGVSGEIGQRQALVFGAVGIDGAHPLEQTRLVINKRHSRTALVEANAELVRELRPACLLVKPGDALHGSLPNELSSYGWTARA